MTRHAFLTFFALIALANLVSARPVETEIAASAVVGQPLGVGYLEWTESADTDAQSLALVEPTGRAQYPVIFQLERRGPLRELFGRPQRLGMYFVFRGNEPLQMNIEGGRGVQLRISPKPFAAADHATLAASWSKRYAEHAVALGKVAEYPPIIETYLAGRVGLRLGQPQTVVDPLAATKGDDNEELKHAVRVLGATESLRLDYLRAIAGSAEQTLAPADQPLPAPVALAKPSVVAPATPPEIEPIAQCVPPDAFYIRFGEFRNYLWMGHRMDEWGGAATNLVTERSIDYHLEDRLQEQLALQESQLADIFGPSVISDIAVIGYDTFMRDGATMGVLFEAKQNELLTKDFADQREEARRLNKQAKQEDIKLADGTPCIYVHSPDNRVRSFYVNIGKYHLVSTSKVLAERFAIAAKGGPSLGKSPEFIAARGVVPITRQDTIFAFLSSAFFEQLLSPQVQVELQRRMQSLAEIDAVNIARIAAAAEGVQATPGNSLVTVEQLVAAEYLPRNFGVHVDGSQLVEAGGALVDTVRGPRGMLVPIGDMPVEGVTAAEAKQSVRLGESFAASWQQVSPLIVSIKKDKGRAEGLERVTLDVLATPLARKQYQMIADQLGAPTTDRVARIPGDVVSIDAVLGGGGMLGGLLGGGLLGGGGGGQQGDYHLIGGLRDADPRMAYGGVLDKVLGFIGGKEIVGYLGATPHPGILNILGASNALPVDANGYSQFFTGGYRLVTGPFTLLGFQPQLLGEVASQLHFEPAARAGQVWLEADDLRQSRLAPIINAYGYKNARAISNGNARLLDLLTVQLRVPAEQTVETADRLLAGRLVCPLKGEYKFDSSSRSPHWISTAWQVPVRGGGAFPPPPADYEHPALYWLRGIALEGRATEAELAVHAELQMPVKTMKGFELPSLNGLFGTAAPKKPTTKKAEEVAPKPASTSKEF